jgi:hypothetical protein
VITTAVGPEPGTWLGTRPRDRCQAFARQIVDDELTVMHLDVNQSAPVSKQSSAACARRPLTVFRLIRPAAGDPGRP